MTQNVDDMIDTLKKLTNQIDDLSEKVQTLVKESHELNKSVNLNKEVCFLTIFLF